SPRAARARRSTEDRLHGSARGMARRTAARLGRRHTGGQSGRPARFRGCRSCVAGIPARRGSPRAWPVDIVAVQGMADGMERVNSEQTPVSGRPRMAQTVRLGLRRLYRELMPLLYARTNFKVFLERSFQSLDRRTAAILCSTNVLPGMMRAVPLRAPFGRSMLVVSPHQDDDII